MVCCSARDAVLRDADALWYEVLAAGHRSYFRHVAHNYTVGPAVVRDIPMKPYPNFKTVEGGGLWTQQPPITWRLGRAEWPSMPPRAGREGGFGTLAAYNHFAVGGLYPQHPSSLDTDPQPPEAGSAENAGIQRKSPFTEEETRTLAQHALRVARLRASKCCGMCGSKNKHLQVWGLGMRVCGPCMKENLVSGAALFHDYGVDFNRISERLAGKVFYFRHDYRPKQLASFVTHNPVDFRTENAHSMVFFWRPHLERVVDLAEFRRKIKDPARIAAAQRLSSAVRALRVRLFLSQKCKSRRTCHSFHLASAGAGKAKRRGAYTLRPLADAERLLVLEHLPKFTSRSEFLSEPEARARRLLQESFLGWRGPSTLPSIKYPESALEKLRTIEATRGELVLKNKPPTFLASTRAFRRWFDLAPVVE